MLALYNTRTKKIETFTPVQKKRVGLYSCGPTVYQYAHLGNLRSYIYTDVLKRVLLLHGYRVRHIMNITDVGHLTNDSDIGEDKIEQEARKKHVPAKKLTKFYERAFWKDIKRLHILPPDIAPRATEHMKEQIALLKKLEKKGYTYRTSDGIYFNTKKFSAYGAFSRPGIQGLKAGARVQMGEKRTRTDFALWKFSPSAKNGVKRQMEWKSPWGIGFPGWHLECSAMSIKYLGESFDIHTGGIDHVQIHHTNEIAQSEAVTEKVFARYWLHWNFLTVKEEKIKRMGKSEGNVILLDDIISYGYNPLDFRYLTLTVHWQTPLRFSWEALNAAKKARGEIAEYFRCAPRGMQKKERDKIFSFFDDNLHTPKALAYLWKLIEQKKATKELLLWADHVFGLSLLKESRRRLRISSDIHKLVREREQYRTKKDWGKADRIRKKLENRGWHIEDTAQGPVVHRL